MPHDTEGSKEKLEEISGITMKENKVWVDCMSSPRRKNSDEMQEKLTTMSGDKEYPRQLKISGSPVVVKSRQTRRHDHFPKWAFSQQRNRTYASRESGNSGEWEILSSLSD